MGVLGFAHAPRGHAAMFAGYDGGESTGYKKALSKLKAEGMIEYPSSDSVSLTPKGQREFGNVEAPKTNAETLERLLKVVNKSGKSDSKANLICQSLEDGRAHSLDAVAEASGYPSSKSSGFPKAVGKLSGFGLVERTKDKKLRLADMAFPYGRPGSTSSGNTAPGGGAEFVSGTDSNSDSDGDSSE